MGAETLGEHFDIHGGGMDLKFPHHECEIAQSEGASGHPHVNYWIHNGFVQIDNEKMSKSLGNFFTVRDVLKKYDGETLRAFILSSHYRGPLNYSDAALDEAKKALTRLYSALAKAPADSALDNEAVAAFDEAMNDDFNTPKAFAVLFDLARRLNSGETALAATLKTLGGRLGLLQQNPADWLKGENSGSLSEADILARIHARAEAKAAKDYARADAIRAELAAQGIIIKDTADGTEWRYE